MKIAFALFKYFPFGGMQRAFFRIAQKCHERGHEVFVFTMSWKGEIPSWIHLNIISSKGVSNHQKCQNFSESFSSIVEKENFDLVVGFNRMPNLDVCYVADLCFKEGLSQKSFWHRAFPRYRIFLRLEQAVFDPLSKTKILLVSEREKKIFQKHYDTASERFLVLSPGISRDRIRPANALFLRQEFRKMLEISDQETVLLSIASSFHTKGLDRIIRALAYINHKLTHKKISLWVIGDDKKTFYEKMAKQYGIISLVKFFEPTMDLIKFLVSADILVHPARKENTGNVLLEAIVAGLPVLTTEACGYAHYVETSGGGWVESEPFSQKKFNERLEWMLSLERLEVFQKAALHYAKDANFFSLIDEAVSFLEGCAQSKRSID